MPPFSCKCIVGPSIAKDPSYSEYIFDIYTFILESNDFNYYNFLDEKYIEEISYIDDSKKELKIKLNRIQIRSCDDRYIIIELNTCKITHYIVPLSGTLSEYYKESVLDNSALNYKLIEKKDHPTDSIISLISRYLVYPVIIGVGMITSRTRLN